MNLLSAKIVELSHGADHVSLETDLPEPTWPYVGHLCLSFRVAKGQALGYLEKNFPELVLGGKVEIICDSGEWTPFSKKAAE